jgi:SAM-dependent methyltransferase
MALMPISSSASARAAMPATGLGDPAIALSVAPPPAAPAVAAAHGQLLLWQAADGTEQRVFWRSESGAPAPRRLRLLNDQTPADRAYHWACEGVALLWQGDYQNARQLLLALSRRLDKALARQQSQLREAEFPQAFHLYRKLQAQRSRILGMLLLPLSSDYQVALRRAPDVQAACQAAYGAALPAPVGPSWISLRELQGLIGAYEWQKKGVPLPALGQDERGQVRRIHPQHGVYSPVRGEYLELLRRAPWPKTATLAFDVGTGSGVIAALLALRGAQRVLASDTNVRALACARDNLQRLGLDQRVELLEQDLFPQTQADLVVCNPPWLPGKPANLIEHAIYDPDSRMLRAFLAGLRAHLRPAGEGWLLLSDLAEQLGLRSRAQVLGWIEQGGLQLLGRDEIAPQHPRASDPNDPLQRARRAERTALWRLAAR